MARIEYAGGAPSTTVVGAMSSAASPGAGGTFTLGDGTGWPTGVNGHFIVTVDPDDAAGHEEKIECSSRTGNVVTVAVRGVDGSTAQAHTAGAPIKHEIDATSLNDLQDHIYDTSRDDHPFYIRADGTRAFTALSAVANTTPTTVAIADVATAGVSLELARSDHKHGFPQPDVPTDSAPGDVNSAGTGSKVSRADHKHGREAFGGSGTATSVAHSDHSHLASASKTEVTSAGTVTATAYGDPATGSTGPAVTLTVPASGRVMILMTCYSTESLASQSMWMALAISGADTVAAPAQNFELYQGDGMRFSLATVFTGLTPGSSTFTAKFRLATASGTGTLVYRSLTVIPL